MLNCNNKYNKCFAISIQNEDKDDDQVIEVGGRVESDDGRHVDRLPDRNLNVLTVDDFRFAI
jgi:hypothetical protein